MMGKQSKNLVGLCEMEQIGRTTVTCDALQDNAHLCPSNIDVKNQGYTDYKQDLNRERT
jgi:hypothetical protein